MNRKRDFLFCFVFYGELLTYGAYIFSVGPNRSLAHELGRPADPPRVVVVERDQVALLVVHRLLGVVTCDIERRVRRGVTVGPRNLRLQELLGNLALHTVLVAPALRSEVVQVVIHVLVVLVGHVVRDIGVRVVVGAEGVGRRRHHQRHEHGDRDGSGQSRPDEAIHIRRGRPAALGVNASERRRGLANLVPGTLERRSDIGNPLEGSRRADLLSLRVGGSGLGLVALPRVELANGGDHKLARLDTLVVDARPLAGEVAIGVNLLEVNDELGARLAADPLKLAERLAVLALPESVLGEGEGDGDRSHFYLISVFLITEV